MSRPSSTNSSLDDGTDNKNDFSLSTNNSSIAISIPSRSSIDADSIDSVSSRDRNVASAMSKHHHTLPTGWNCEYDTNSKNYRFFLKEPSQSPENCAKDDSLPKDHHIASYLSGNKNNETDDNSQRDTADKRPSDSYKCPFGYHFPSSPTPSMLSALAEQVANNTATKILHSKTVKTTGENNSDELELMLRLCKMFPTAPEAMIVSMTRTYHHREKLIIASLISQGFRRAGDRHLPTVGAIDPTALIATRPASKKLFEKLMGYFPDRDESYIKNLMVKYNEVEHEIISAIVESSSLNDSTFTTGANNTASKLDLYEDKGGVMMKLRYLKILYPECDELEIFHLLHSNDMNAQNVMAKIEAKGIQKSDIEAIMNKRKLLNQQKRTQQAARSVEIQNRDKALLKPSDVIKKPAKPIISDEKLKSLKEVFKKEFPNVCEGLIELALDASNYSEGIARRCLRDMTPDEDYTQRVMMDEDNAIDERILPCRSTQTQVNYKNVIEGSPVRIPRNLIDEQQAVALTKNSIGTWTEDIFFDDSNKKKLGEGHNQALIDGPAIYQIVRQRPKLINALGRDDRNANGGNPKMLCQPKKLLSCQQIIDKKLSLASGPQPEFKVGHDRSLTKKLHPFFV